MYRPRPKELGHETKIFHGAFAAAVQYSQIEDVLASGNFAGFIVAPNDSVRIAGAFEQVIAAGVLPTMIDKSVLDANPDLKGEWAQQNLWPGR